MKILTIDLEDWFHILAHDATASPSHWENFESRVERNSDWILEQLSKYNQPATFFSLGWIAQKYPALIRKISAEGYEIACHSMNHQLVYEQTHEQFRSDLTQSIDILQQLTGKKIKSYRAPGFSISEKTKWIFEILVEAGIENDCSIFPAERNHGGFGNFPSAEPCLLSLNGKTLRAFPMSLGAVLRKRIVFSGGGYFRLLPYSMIKRMMKSSGYVMTYFHPRDFDAGQPMIESLPLKRKFMSYVGLRSSGAKFIELLNDFKFTNVEKAVLQIDWNAVKKVDIMK